jgi:HD superfamily phosphohydrolase
MNWSAPLPGMHEIRDPIHTFIRLDDEERKIVDSQPVQRLRQIHQLATSYLVYPGATHRRFEHSLGVMELAGRAFDVVTHPDNVHRELPDELQAWLLDRTKSEERLYWRRVLRAAALCHDIGHLPFSHVAEGSLLPEGWRRHEQYTVALIRSNAMQALWHSPRPQLDTEDIAKLSVGQEHFPSAVLSDREAILSEIIVGSAFGADRMDYLLRDSLHAGVAYGRFDHARLIDTLRILPQPAAEDETRSQEPQLGVTDGGLHAAEALLIARYFMFTQVYFHRVRRIYDIHLRDFLADYLKTAGVDGRFPVDLERYLALTDSEVLSALNAAARDPDLPGHEPARCIVHRQHYRLLWERSPTDARTNPNLGGVILAEAEMVFGQEALRRDPYAEKNAAIDFPVVLGDGEVVSARSRSDMLSRLPTSAFDFIFVRPDVAAEARKWLRDNWQRLLAQTPEEKD